MKPYPHKGLCGGVPAVPMALGQQELRWCSRWNRLQCPYLCGARYVNLVILNRTRQRQTQNKNSHTNLVFQLSNNCVDIKLLLFSPWIYISEIFYLNQHPQVIYNYTDEKQTKMLNASTSPHTPSCPPQSREHIRVISCVCWWTKVAGAAVVLIPVL